MIPESDMYDEMAMFICEDLRETNGNISIPSYLDMISKLTQANNLRTNEMMKRIENLEKLLLIIANKTLG